MSVFQERQAQKLKRKFEEKEDAVDDDHDDHDDDVVVVDDDVNQAPVVASGKLAELPLLLRPKDAIAPSMLHQRQKQIDIGKNTRQYRRYVTLIPRHQRTAEHPRTPDPRKPVSRRQFDGLLRQWRQLLHRFDDGVEEEEEEEEQQEIEIDIRTLADEWESIETELRLTRSSSISPLTN
jgi:hypothetical protein